MSLFGGYLPDVDEDPFFGHHMRSMQQMSSMMNSMFGDPFNMFGGMGMGMGRPRGPRGGELMPFGFPNMNMNNIFDGYQMRGNDPSCHSFSSSTVMTMSSGPDGRPQVYQASQSTRTAPGGIKETKKTVSDSRTGTKKMAIGHHIGDRAHVMEREHNLHSGDQEERQEFINLEEEEADDFNREWEHRTRYSGNNAIGYNRAGAHPRRSREELPAILDRPRVRARTSRDTPRRQCPAITSSSSSDATKPAEPERRATKKRTHTSDDESSADEESRKVQKTDKTPKSRQ